MEIKLDNEQLNQAMNAAILSAIGETGREHIIKCAVEYLVKRPDNSYNGRKEPSPLERIVMNSAEQIARTIMTEKFQNDPDFKANIERLYTDAFQRVFTGEGREKVVELMASKMSEALRSERY